MTINEFNAIVEYAKNYAATHETRTTIDEYSIMNESIFSSPNEYGRLAITTIRYRSGNVFQMYTLLFYNGVQWKMYQVDIDGELKEVW